MSINSSTHTVQKTGTLFSCVGREERQNAKWCLHSHRSQYEVVINDVSALFIIRLQLVRMTKRCNAERQPSAYTEIRYHASRK